MIEVTEEQNAIWPFTGLGNDDPLRVLPPSAAQAVPYMVVYVVSEERIDVLALVSVRRDPEWIEETVAGRTGE